MRFEMPCRRFALAQHTGATVYLFLSRCSIRRIQRLSVLKPDSGTEHIVRY